MASINIKTENCGTCIQNSDEQKVKPGIILCDGCHQAYCLSHFVEHQQTWNNTLNNIAGQRDILQSRIEELPKRMSEEHLKTINNWENIMLQTVTEAATNARKQVCQLIISETERECSELTSKITSFRINDDCLETDLEELQAKIEKLNKELNALSGLHPIQLNLSTLDCSNMIHIKSFEIHSLSETANSNDSIILKPKDQYRSFIEHFLTTHKPFVDLSIQTSGYMCASSTMLIDVNSWKAKRFFFNRESMSEFNWEYGSPFDIQWSFWLQQFIVLTSTNIVAVDAVEKEGKSVVEVKHTDWQCMNHWKHLCLVIDHTNRIFCYEMNKNLDDWLLLYCWSVPTTCARNEKITAIGLNEYHIVLSIQCDDQPRFAVHKHDMIHCLNIRLTHPCTTIQALPHGEWLFYDSAEKVYYVIDSRLEQHDEPYLSSLKNFELIISYDDTGKVLLVLLSRKTVFRGSKRKLRVYKSN